VATFRELAQSIAASWKTIDDETMEFCSAVEKALKQMQVVMKDPKFVDHTTDQQQQSSKPSDSNIWHQTKLKPKKQAKKKQIIKPKQVRSKQEQAVVKPKQVRSKQVVVKPNPKPVTRQVASVSVSSANGIVPSVPSNAAAPVGASLPFPTSSAMAPQPASIVQNFLFRDNNTLCNDDLSIQPIATTLDEDNLVCGIIATVPSNAAAAVRGSLPFPTPSAMAPQSASIVQKFFVRDNNTLRKDNGSIQPIATTWDEDNLIWDASEDAEIFGACDPGDDLRTVVDGFASLVSSIQAPQPPMEQTICRRTATDESTSLVSSIQAPRPPAEQMFCYQQPSISENTARPSDPCYNGTANTTNINNGINSMNSNLTSVGNRSNLSTVYTTLMSSNRGVPAANVSDDDIRRMWEWEH